MILTQKDLYAYLWTIRQHRCAVSKKPIRTFGEAKFIHMLGATTYKRYKLDPKNVMIVFGEEQATEIRALCVGNERAIEKEIKKGKIVSYLFLKSL